ncbi:hypothetical protein ACQ4M4_16520 [Leptolyngbya sp. AN02str]|uniref:hypothetical protein n=1 Tax=Leptolyngbya sp. AN02str TaxID=3423363 RepID=UPI003D3240FA
MTPDLAIALQRWFGRSPYPSPTCSPISLHCAYNAPAPAWFWAAEISIGPQRSLGKLQML